jgi:(E)-4-hydroxy-3-methylbut-2-enyl-diphosphate synthase
MGHFFGSARSIGPKLKDTRASTMSVRPYRDIHRRQSRQIHVGNVPVGGDAPITVQSMTNTDCEDIQGTVEQIKRLEDAGCDIVRVSCPSEESTAALKQIVPQVDIPIVADIHFHYKRAIEAAEAGAACLRINPGNIGSRSRVQEVVKAAKDHGCSMRIGVNAGSLERDILEKYGEPCPDAMVESALNHARILEEEDFYEFKISCKASDVFLAVAAYMQLADACDYPLHIGITEAGGQRSGTIKSSIGLGNLLWAGIGDTVRVSLSCDPVEEIKVGYEILKSLGLRHRGVNVISCPSCARQQFDVIETVRKLEDRLEHISTPLTVSVIGCVVNGPGEATLTDVGFTGGGRGTHQVYVNGLPSHRLKDEDIVDHLVKQVEEKAAEIEAKKDDQRKAEAEDAASPGSSEAAE